MYITEAIERAKQLHPNEYSVKECIDWCDELSSDIMRNYNEQYGKITAGAAHEVLLPENVLIEDVARVIMDGKELDKTNLLGFGVQWEYSVHGRTLKKTDDGVSDFEIIYRQPHIPTRYIDTDCEITAGDGYFKCDDIGIYAGDTLKIKSGESEYTVYITDIVTGDSGTKYMYSGDTLTSGNVNIRREIQDMTLLPAPYDAAYIDFLNMKVSLYQGDESGYQAFTAQFSAKMSDYSAYINRNKPREKKKIINWW